MQSFAAIDCPHCGEVFEIAVDLSEPESEFVTDCEICCRPMTIAVRVEDGEVQSIQISAC